MAFGNLTVDFKQLMSVPLQQRVQLARSSASSEIFGNLSPTEIAKLFPKYYKDNVPAVGSLSGATSGYSGGGGGGSSSASPASGNNKVAAPPPPPMSSVQKIIQMSQPTPTFSGNSNQKAAQLTNQIMRDLNLSRTKAAAIVGNFMHESGGFQKLQEIAPRAGRGGYGWAQWTGPRRRNFESFAASKGLDPASDEANYQFFLHEIRNDPYEKSRFDSWVANDFGSIENETVAFEQAYERAGVKHHASRVQYAQVAMQGSLEQAAEEIQSPEQASTPAQSQGASSNTDINLIDVDNPDSRPNNTEAQVIPETNTFDPALLDPALLQQYQTSSDTEKKQFEEAVMRKGYEWANNIHKEHATQNPEVTATEIVQQGQPDQKIKPVPGDAESLMEFWNARSPRTPKKELIAKVDPDLLKSAAEAVQMYEAANPRYRVEIFGPSGAARYSGSTGNHGIKADGYSKALDFVIIDRETGEQLVNLGRHGGGQGYGNQKGGTGLGFQELTKLHALTRIAQEHFAPHEKNYRHGTGWTGGDVPFDAMHGDIRGDALGDYSWEKGYSPNFRRQFGMEENLVLGDETRIKELGQQIFGEVDQNGNYVNQAAFARKDNGDTTVVSQKVKRLEESVADVQAPADTEATQPVDNPTADIQATVTTTPLVPPSATPAEEPRNMMLGGTSPNLVNEGVQITNTDTGEQVNVNDREKISTDEHGNLHVKSAHKVKAEELQDKYENKPLQQNNPEPEPDMPQEPEKQHKPPEPQANMGKMTSVTEPNRLDKTPLDMSQFYGVPPSPSFGRAMHQARLGEIRATRGNANEV